MLRTLIVPLCTFFTAALALILITSQGAPPKPRSAPFHYVQAKVFRIPLETKIHAPFRRSVGSVIMHTDHAAAQSFYLKSLNSYRDVGDRRGIALTLHNLGMSRVQSVTIPRPDAIMTRAFPFGPKSGPARNRRFAGRIFASCSRVW